MTDTVKGLPEWAEDVSSEVAELCQAADRFLGAQRANAIGMGAGSGMMNAAEDRARIDLECAYDRIPRRFKTEAFSRLHDALADACRTAVEDQAAGELSAVGTDGLTLRDLAAMEVRYRGDMNEDDARLLFGAARAGLEDREPLARQAYVMAMAILQSDLDRTADDELHAAVNAVIDAAKGRTTPKSTLRRQRPSSGGGK